MSETHYPFVLIPEECNGLELYRERPKLALAIVVVTSWRNPERQSAVRTRFLREIGESFFVNAEKSFDLLQAVLVYLGW